MKYILLIYGDEKVWGSMSEEDMRQVYADHRMLSDDMAKAGVLEGGAELMPSTAATSVRFSSGGSRITDGPFAETKEHLGGYYVINVDNLDQALEWARRMPGMPTGTVEVRPLAPVR